MNVKEQSQGEKIDAVIQQALYCHIALSVDDQPYVIPVSYGYQDNALYFHSGPKGKKLELLKENPRVGFSIEHQVELKEAKSACKYSMLYASVIGKGRAHLLESIEEKSRGLDIVVKHYNAEPLEYTEESLRSLEVIQIDISEMTYKETRTG
ncbi:MAG: pyridoxamine 5'-phosphate oxidase family protein [Anaerolineaceae bacterium]|nr:pyridoxamine 5'-phosphate oxidase family protein [Anaerolineaceae bacterium]